MKHLSRIISMTSIMALSTAAVAEDETANRTPAQDNAQQEQVKPAEPVQEEIKAPVAAGGFDTADYFGFIPHISLLYGDFKMSELEEIRKTVEPLKPDWQAGKLVVYQDSTDPNAWAHLAEFELTP
jgi:hypothetical protein